MRRRLLLSLAALLLARPAAAVDRQKGARSLLPGAPVFIDLDPIVLPVIERNSVTRQVDALLTLELAKGRQPEEFEPHRLQLTDAFITELYRLYSERSGADRVVNEALVKRRLQAVADHVLGPGIVRAVLIRQLIERRQ